LVTVVTLMSAIVASALIAWWRAREEVRNSFARERDEVASILERAHVSLTTAREAIDESADRSARARARVEQAERRQLARDAAEAPAASPRFTAATYKRHLERHGKRDRSFEATLTPGASNGRAG